MADLSQGHGFALLVVFDNEFVEVFVTVEIVLVAKQMYKVAAFFFGTVGIDDEESVGEGEEATLQSVEQHIFERQRIVGEPCLSAREDGALGVNRLDVLAYEVDVRSDRFGVVAEEIEVHGGVFGHEGLLTEAGQLVEVGSEGLVGDAFPHVDGLGLEVGEQLFQAGDGGVVEVGLLGVGRDNLLRDIALQQIGEGHTIPEVEFLLDGERGFAVEDEFGESGVSGVAGLVVAEGVDLDDVAVVEAHLLFGTVGRRRGEVLVERAAVVHGDDPLGSAADSFVFAFRQTHMVGTQNECATALETFVIVGADAGDKEHGINGLRCYLLKNLM